ncbi:GDYXXLXY domain-containing protein [Roseateles sp.]|uniref:GDYXXLXY domain-containing protein n=1 Tax=Roseateles sp. TaxID=1971397 RepID=UPI0039ED61ED
MAATEVRPWPVVLLTAAGAWLAAVPLLAAVALMFGPLFQHGGAYLAGVMLLLGAVAMLRANLPLFAEQLAVPLLLAGGASLGFGLFRDLQEPAAPAVLALMAWGAALAVREHWLKACLGAVAALFTAMVFWSWVPSSHTPGDTAAYWLGWHVCVGAWLLAAFRERRAGLGSGLVAMATGWLVMCLLGLALLCNLEQLLGGRQAGFAGEHPRADWPGFVSSGLTLLGAGWLGLAWPSLRRPAYGGVALVLAGLAIFMPALGAALLALAGSAARARWRLATAAVLAATWIVGSFYYQLSWPLVTKAAMLAAAGVLLGLLAWPLWPRGGLTVPSKAGGGVGRGHARIGAAASLVAVLAVVNAGIAQKEALIADGQPIFVPLAPVDPRSLMQGDFMRLNFALPGEVPAQAGGLLAVRRPHVVASLDERRIARLLRLHDGSPLAPGELLIELTPKGGRWTVVTDAWFFQEGEARRWSAARFGEFRVKPDGQALLVGLRNEALGKL